MEPGSTMLNGFDRNGQQVIDEADFLLQEWLRVSPSPEHAVEAGANLIVGREQILARLLVAELRLVCQDGSELPLKLLRNVDDKRGPHIIIKRRVDDLEWTMGRKKSSAGVSPAVPWASRPRLTGGRQILKGFTDT